eukprot:g28648.t1
MGRMLRGCAYVVAAIASVLPLTGWLLDRQSRACVPVMDDLNLSLPAWAGLSRDGSHSLQINLRDGRSLGYATWGDKSTAELALFYFHGFPSSRFEAGGFWHVLKKDAPSLAARVFLVAPERPGAGLSTYQPDRTARQWAADVLALADALYLQQFAVVGFSGGGPYALACAHALPSDRLRGTVVIAGVAPSDVAPKEGLKLSNRILFSSLTFPLTPLFMTGMAAHMRGLAAQASPDLSTLTQGLPKVDQQAFEDPLATRFFMIQSGVGAFQCGVAGPVREMAIVSSYDKWNFRLDQLAQDASQARSPRKVHFFQGGVDVNVPKVMAAWQCAEINRSNTALCVLHEFPDEGHISLVIAAASQVVQLLMAA